MTKQFAFLLITLMLQQLSALAQTYKTTIDIRIPFPPSPITINGVPTSYYEMYVTNFSSNSIQIQKLEIMDAANASVYFTCEGADLRNRFASVGTNKKDSLCIIHSGSMAIVYVELPLPIHTKQTTVDHKLHVAIQSTKGISNEIIQGTKTPMAPKDMNVIGAPVAEGTWTAVNEPSWERGHRRVVYTVNGRARIPGRFAIDFIKVNEEGKDVIGNEDSISNYLGYGAAVLAVADGVVSTVNNNFTESKTLSGHPDHTADKATGNYISIKINDSLYAFYEHLQPGSIKVKQGQRVKKGDVIAALGFTGQTTGPHLHFHMANHDSPLGAEGVPFVFEQFTYQGIYSNLDHFGQQKWTSIKSNQMLRKKERPAPNSVIVFQSNK